METTVAQVIQTARSWVGGRPGREVDDELVQLAERLGLVDTLEPVVELGRREPSLGVRLAHHLEHPLAVGVGSAHRRQPGVLHARQYPAA